MYLTECYGKKAFEVKIITRLDGGIGNQFFQYAAARFLAIKNNAELLLDDSLLTQSRIGVTKRNYELGAYNIKAKRLDKTEQSTLQFRARRPFRYLYEMGFLKSSFAYYREPHFEYDPQLIRLTGNLIIDGYWQSERYFNEIADDIRRELQPIEPPSPNEREFLSKIIRVNSVSLHIRRGDFIINPMAAAHHVVCDLTYYQRAVSMVAKRVLNPVFFVFSDDPVWVKKELRLDYPMVLVSRSQSWPAYEDLRLMSNCMHHIIANSSFSWWGAWLNPSSSKIVVAPSRWFRVEKNTKDLTPPEWYLV